MTLFQKAKKENAFLKAGIMGFAGSGKSMTSARLAIGLHKFIKNDKPIFYLDTETGSDYLLPMFEKEGIEVAQCKSRAFIDLVSSVNEAEANESILIIDSITHFWNEVMSAFKRKKNLQRLTIQHWMPIKEEWRVFTERYINSKCHIIMAGRAGWEFDMQKDEEGFSELVKTGTKMKVEGEMGYEPSLLVEMEKVRKSNGKIGGDLIRKAWVIKDRFDVIDGKNFDNPDFESFLPHIQLLNLGGEHKGVEEGRTSEAMFETDNSMFERRQRHDILIEEINDQLMLMYDRSDQGKKDRIKKLEQIFGSSSKTSIEAMPNDVLEEGLVKLKAPDKPIQVKKGKK